ncbi:hypothetical protein ACFYY8_31685 [Streptosporangium sp. NPDC001559]|uniref:hypothetical protein n=1 Tax=Streptosporangium sp. NPDC001559 TaxID=3366187 RepID=UPI0036E2DC0C
MPLAYPENLPTRVERLERLLEQLYTASQTRPAQDTIRTAALTIGDPSGPHIKLIPDGDDGAEVWLAPQAGADPTRLVADVTTGYPGEATFHVLSAGGSTTAEFNVASGEVNMLIHGPSGTGEAGGQAYWGHDAAGFGFVDGTHNNYFNFTPNGVSRHYGQWDDFASLSSTAGWLWGSVTVSGSGTSTTLSYPSVMASNMGPIIGFRPGNATANLYWVITASSTSGVSIAWSVSQSVAIYLCSFRH